MNNIFAMNNTIRRDFTSYLQLCYSKINMYYKVKQY